MNCITSYNCTTTFPQSSIRHREKDEYIQSTSMATGTIRNSSNSAICIIKTRKLENKSNGKEREVDKIKTEFFFILFFCFQLLIHQERCSMP